MLRLFQSLFSGGAEKGPYPESLVRGSIERAVDGTDPNLRGLSGYRKKLRPAVLLALDHVVALADELAAPIDASRAGFGLDPRMNLFFVSADHLQKVLDRDPNLAEFQGGPGADVQEICALLIMEKQERKTLGVDCVGDIVMKDVLQETVSFANHRLLDPTGDEKETRRLLKRRAFDHLLEIALGRIAAASDQRAGLERRRTLLQAKLNVLQRGGHWGFDTPDSPEVPDAAEMQVQIDRIEAQLLELGGDADTLKTNLNIVAEVLSRPREQLWSEPIRLIVDRMGIKRSQATGGATEFVLAQLHNARGRSVVVSLVILPRRLSDNP